MCISVPSPVLGSVGTPAIDNLVSDDPEMPDLIDAGSNLSLHAILFDAIHIPLRSNHSRRRTTITYMYSIGFPVDNIMLRSRHRGQQTLLNYMTTTASDS
jgi:hypothetical protein